MRLQQEVVYSLGALVLMNLLSAFSSIGLLDRMGPAVDRILRDNVQSLAAAEDMLQALALAPERLDPDDSARVRTALAKARENVTEAAEPVVLDRVEQALNRSERGEAGARTALVQAIADLAEVNREAMRRSAQDARRLGRAGGWAAALGGAFALWLCLFVAVRLRRRLVSPVLRMQDVLQAEQGGDRFRRLGTATVGDEWKYVFGRVDYLLDEASRRPKSSPQSEVPSAPRRPAPPTPPT
jgi:hypothetical protein